ncbi:craniofacial development protein 1 [Clupea harengus]|uniref:Craniofacial development protein 1 n=1 Tax=Clupea harengus TaxID=7950 RepID=A0A6P8FAN4_CLUHA|nr:craniofacial development protein 1 [Clupea harengus]
MMNYSDYDSDDYSSNEDEDYVPSDDNLSEDDMNECVPEDGLDGEGQGEPQSEGMKKKKKKGKDITARKRKKVGLKLEGEEEDETKEQEESEKGAEEEPTVEPEPKEEKKQKKADDLWASFLSDVGQRPKTSTTPTSTSTSQKLAVTDSSDKEGLSENKKEAPKEKAPSKITITKVFDFAGEEVRVTKEVEADSKEAKSYLMEEEGSSQSEATSHGPGPSVKRPAGVSGILNRIGGKKQKMSTLEKSRLDWDTFKDEEGISDELAIHNRGKEGYVERKNFLERVDQRQFKLERDVRLTNMKR